MTQTGITTDANEVKLAGARCATDLSAKEGYFVKLGTPTNDGYTVALCAAATDKPIGIVKKGADGSVTPKAIEVAIEGQSRVVSGAAVTAGQRVQTDANGKCIPAAATGYAIGQALTTCTAADEMLTIAHDCKNPQLVA